jgi:hypothetical protein
LRDAYKRGNLRLSWERLPYGRERLVFVCNGRVKEALLEKARGRYGEHDGYTESLQAAVDEACPFEEFVPQGDEGVEFAEDLKAINHPEAAVIAHVWAVEPERTRLESQAEALLERARVAMSVPATVEIIVNPIVPPGSAYLVDATAGGAIERIAAILLERRGKPLTTPVLFAHSQDEAEAVTMAAVESMLKTMRANRG